MKDKSNKPEKINKVFYGYNEIDCSFILLEEDITIKLEYNYLL